MTNPVKVPGEIAWLNIFLAKTFFIACGIHTSILGNLVNLFCTDCKTSACNHCLATGTHTDHKVITIHRHFYREVVNLDEMRGYIDCSGIQTHMCEIRRRLVIALHPLPNKRPGSSKSDNSCLTCAQDITKSKRIQYCSIVCKFPLAKNEKEPKIKETTSKPPSTDDEKEPKTKETSKPPPRSERNRRKGIPMRSPMF